MRREISAGIIVFRRSSEGKKFLVLYHGHNYWNFPKGKIESEEKSFEAALRETREETGLGGQDLKIMNGFRAYERFSFKRDNQEVFKIVIFYLAETKNPIVKISKEHQGYGWFLYPEAQKILGTYQDSKRVLKLAHDFLRGQSNQRGKKNPPRPRPNVPRSGPPGREPEGMPRGR